jgi:molybdenum cofactor cytidylyltransferase
MTGNKSLKIGGILLAAGGSSRMGRPKQFLPLEGETLLRRTAKAMEQSLCDPVVAVLGAEREIAEAELAEIKIEICFNPHWSSGMSSSIRAGLERLLAIGSDLDAVVITLCDQPFVNAQTIDRLIETFATSGTQMVAAKYVGVAGVPALFSREMFDALSRLEGDKGARDLLRDPEASVATIEIEEAAIDIDTLDDIGRLKLL